MSPLGDTNLFRVIARLIDIVLCAVHWRAAQDFPPSDLRTVSVLNLAECFAPGCGEDAATIVGRYDEDPRPVCRRHLEDLSWIDLPQDVLLDPGDTT